MDLEIQTDEDGTPFVESTQEDGFRIGLQAILDEQVGDWKDDFDKFAFLSWFTSHRAKLPQHEFDWMVHEAIQEWDSSDG